MSVEIRRASDRFLSRSAERVTRHSFSFGEHYDTERLRFGPMVCHDDHWLAGGSGFTEHPHQDLEIVTWVLAGELAHDDSDGHSGVVAPGQVQVLSAGSGVAHSEIAPPGAPTRFVQVWLTPDEPGGATTYAVAPVELPSGVLVPVAAGENGGTGAPTRIGTAGATFWVARLAAGESVTLPDAPLQHVFVGRGALVRSSLAQPLTDGDAFLVTDHPGLELTASVPTELLVWTFAA